MSRTAALALAVVVLSTLTACATASPRPTADTARIETPVRRLDGRELSPAQVSATVERLMAAGKVTGLGLAVVNHGEVVYQRAFGLAEAATARPLDEHTVMYLASITKAMFASLVVQLAAEGVVDLDAPIAKLLPKPLPEYPKYADLAGDERWREITPRMLLSHTSGLPNWRWFDFDQPVRGYDPKGKLKLRHAPGTAYGYSGEGINLLQFVLEEGLKLDVGALMQRRVFDRYGMKRTSMVWRDDFAPNVAHGHDEQGKDLGHNQRGSARAAGSGDGDLDGIARFLRAMVRGDGLSPAASQALLTPQVRIRTQHQFPGANEPVFFESETDRDDRVQLSYGLGVGLLATPYGRAFFKGGHDDGWENYLIGFPDAGLGLVVLTNSSNGEGIFTALLAELIADTFTPSEWERYEPYSATPTEP